MKNLKTILLVVLAILAASLYLAYTRTHVKPQASEFQNVILIGWDGAERDSVYKLLEKGKLPNLQKIVSQGNIVNIDIKTTDADTVTKPGWAQILTGYIPEDLGILNNLYYRPIPKGYTIFERLEEYFGRNNIVTVFVAGKEENLGARGPHKVCANCLTRYPDTHEKTGYLHEDTKAPTRNPGEERIFEQREGEPYYHAKQVLDVYEVGLRSASHVGPKATSVIEKYKNRRFFAFFHFEEPDEVGHKYKGNSEEYLESIINNDYWLGEILKKLTEVGIYEKTLVYVTADHGFDEGKFIHKKAPYVFLATNDKGVTKDGEAKDITPTILNRYGIDIKSIVPPLPGSSLIEKESPKITFVVREFLSDAPAIIADELGYYKEEGLDVKTIIVPKGKDTAPLFIGGSADFAILGDKWSLLSQFDDESDAEIIADLGGGGKRWRLMVKNDSTIAKLEDLHNKKIGFWTDSYGYARFSAFLSKKNITITPVKIRGMTPKAVLDILRGGTVDGVLVWEPYPSLIEEERLGREVLNLAEIGEEMSVYLHARRDFLAKSPEAVQPLFRALKRGIDFVRNNPDEAAAILSPKLDVSASAIKKSFQYMNFALRFDENEEEQVAYIIKTFQEVGLHNLPDRPFTKLNDQYIKAYEKNL